MLSETACRGKSVKLLAKCWDLASAYKQVALSDEAHHQDSYIVVCNPSTNAPEIYQQAVLPFGSVASVTEFLRCALGIWMVGARLLDLTWSLYFDDFLSLTTANLAKHTEMCISALFHLLGWTLSEDKLVPFDEFCKVLGVELNLVDSPSGRITVRNTQSRRDELLEFIEGVQSKTLSRCEGEHLRGRLQFASNQIFGRRFRNGLRELNTHVARARSGCVVEAHMQAT